MFMKLRSVKQLKNLSGKRVLVRVDFNVPMKRMGTIVDDARIRNALPTLKYLISNNARMIVASHLGRPGGRIHAKYRLDNVSKRLSRLLDHPVRYMHKTIGGDVNKQVASLKDGEIMVIENLRFHPEEETNNTHFAKQLSVLADIYVNEAFSNCHRKHASMVGITKFLPAYAGISLADEVRVLERSVRTPKHPFVAIIGGAKIASKLPVIKNLLNRVDHILLGGGVANTVMLAAGVDMGSSLVEKEFVSQIKKLLRRKKLLIPTDVVTAVSAKRTNKAHRFRASEIPKDHMALDLGSETIQKYCEMIKRAKTVIWAGPVGMYELTPFASGTKRIASAIARSRAYSVVGGGDSIDAIDRFSNAKHFSHISMGGSAMLVFISGQKLVALKPLMIR